MKMEEGKMAGNGLEGQEKASDAYWGSMMDTPKLPGEAHRIITLIPPAGAGNLVRGRCGRVSGRYFAGVR